MGFSEDIAKFVQTCNRNAHQVVRETVLEIGKSVVMKTPVGGSQATSSGDDKSGYARGNWSHSVSQPDQGVFDSRDESGSASIARIRESIPADAAGKVHYIQNCVPYIMALEEGHSSQAPHGMAAATAAEFEGIVQKALAGLR